MSGAIQIPRQIYDEQMAKLQELYVCEFGEQTTEQTPKQMCRQTIVDTYSTALSFWVKHTPEIDVKKGVPSMDVVAKHAICTNARLNILKHVKKYNIEEAELVRPPNF